MTNNDIINEYITINNCNKIHYKTDEYNLTIIHINIRSLKHNFENVIEFLSTLTIKPHIVCLSETWLNNINNYNLNMSNYKHVINNRHFKLK